MDLDVFDKFARRMLTKAKRAKRVVVRGQRVHLRVELRGSVDHETVELLRTIINLGAHGKTYAPDEPSALVMELHYAVTRGIGFRVPVVFDLTTGHVTLDPAPHETWGK